eukprot:5404489-Pleurochrysis_carterae.AAC.1
MRCQHALGQWEPICQLAADVSGDPDLPDEDRAELAKLGASAAWKLRRWEDMSHYCSQMRKETFETDFFAAVLSVHER